MNRVRLKLAIAAAAGGLLLSWNLVEAQVPPPAKKAARVNIIQGPELELARYGLVIIRWTTNNPGGSDIHFGVVHYGTDPKNLSQTARSQIRVNPNHPETVFRVRLVEMKPRTTYYYRVTAEESNGKSDGVESPVRQFTTPGPGEEYAANPASPVPPSR